MADPKSHFHIQCFEKNPCVNEEKSYSFPDCEESDESEVAVCLPATEGTLPLLEALAPTAYELQHNYGKVSNLNKLTNIYLFPRHS